MKRRSLYLETSIFGFWFDERPVNVEKRQAVMTLLSQVRDGRFHGVVSAFVIRELERADSPQVPLLGLVRDHRVVVAEIDEEEVEGLVNAYIAEEAIEEAHRVDARHVAGEGVQRRQPQGRVPDGGVHNAAGGDRTCGINRPISSSGSIRNGRG